VGQFLKVSRLDMNHPSGNTASTSLPPDPPKSETRNSMAVMVLGGASGSGWMFIKSLRALLGLDEMWCWTRVLWQTVGVEKLALIIESRPNDKFLVAACSACPTRFRLPGNTLGHKELLRKKFEIHCRGVHPEADCPNPNRSRMAS
jgi:hypothetical protein